MTAETSGANWLTIGAHAGLTVNAAEKNFPIISPSSYFKYFKFANTQNEVTAERVLWFNTFWPDSPR